jgi:predicted permease
VNLRPFFPAIPPRPGRSVGQPRVYNVVYRTMRLALTFGGDVRYALRRFRTAPAFSAFTVILLAVSIGATTAAFSLLEGLVLRNLPAPHPEQLVQLTIPYPNFPDGDLTVSEFREIAARQQVFSAMFGAENRFIATVEIAGQFSHVLPAFVTGNFFQELGTRPHVGQLISPEDNAPAARVAVIGYDYWHRQFQGSLSVLGSTIRISDIPFVIVGVAPAHFSGTELDHAPDVMIPNAARYVVEAASDSDADAEGPDVAGLAVVGRLKPGETLAHAAAQLQLIWPDARNAALPAKLDATKKAEFLEHRLMVRSAMKGTDPAWRSQLTDPLWLALAGAAVLLVIACLNLAGLTLARVAAGLHEWQVRAALGASRWQLSRPIVFECLLLTGLGAVGGLPLSLWATVAFRQWLLDGTFPTTSPLSLVPDLRVFTFMTALVLAVTILVSAGASCIWSDSSMARSTKPGRRSSRWCIIIRRR